MPRRHEIGAKLLAVAPELAELEPGIADNARIGRAALDILVDEVVHDPAEVLLEVERVEGDIEAVRDAAGIAGIQGDTAALLAVRAVVLRPMHARAHEEADDVKALLLEQMGRDGAID